MKIKILAFIAILLLVATFYASVLYLTGKAFWISFLVSLSVTLAVVVLFILIWLLLEIVFE